MTDERTPTREREFVSSAGLTLTWDDESPAALASLDAVPLLGRADVPLVEIFTARERRRRTSQALFRSAVGARLRVRDIEETESSDGTTVVVTQVDDRSGLHVQTTVSILRDRPVLQVFSRVTNTSDSVVTVTDISIATVGFGNSEAELDEYWLAKARSEWLAENRWTESPLREALPQLGLPIHAQDGRGHSSLSSHGSWSTGENLPLGVILNVSNGHALAWEIRTSSDWLWDLTQTLNGGVLSLAGPTDSEHHFAARLDPGDSFTTPTAVIAASKDGRDGVLAELTHARRVLADTQISSLPVVYNDFMNTLMGQPSTDALLPLIDAAAAAGAEYFCIDAGWFADPALGDWWTTVGAWREAPTRFTDGLKAVITHIHDRGMRSGLWLEPEVVGVDSPIASTLPPDAFFIRFGERVQEDRRFHLDLRHPAARAHLDETVDHLVAEYGVSFFKLDYNINPGPGTDIAASSPSLGLLEHTRALRDWLLAVQERHPDLLLENCSSGAMRADQHLLSATHLQSTSDQQNFALYAAIAASAPASIRPEQAGNWAYPEARMTLEETAFTLVSGLSGRLYLSGFLDQLSSEQAGLVHEAVSFHKGIRDMLHDSVPFWPLGLPSWEDETLALGLQSKSGTYLFVWDRSDHSRKIAIPTNGRRAVMVFPSALPEWSEETDAPNSARWTTPQGKTARIFRLI